MFVKTQYVIEMTLGSAFFEPVRDTYSVKDAYGNLLGYVKKQRLRLTPKFWFEGTDGTHLGEIRPSKEGYEVYDAQTQLQATIRQKQISPSKKRRSLLGIILFVAGLPVAIFASLGLITGVEGLFIGFFAAVALTVFGVALTVLGVICWITVGYQRPQWRVEDPSSQQLAEIKEIGKFFKEYHILTPDGVIIAHIHKNVVSRHFDTPTASTSHAKASTPASS